MMTPPRALRHLFARFGVRGWGLCVMLLSLSCASSASADEITCTVSDSLIQCEVDVRAYLKTDIGTVLNNGWENSLHFTLAVLNEDEDTVAITYAEVSQRCYIDPFDNPCLALWAGTDAWDSYLDLETMAEGIGHFKLDSIPTTELADGTYHAELHLELNPITDEQATIIRGWLARNRGGHLVLGKNESSIFGTFVSLFANIRSGHAEAELQLLSSPFELKP